MTIVLSHCQIISGIGRNLETRIHPPEAGQKPEGGLPWGPEAAAGWEEDVGKMALISLSLVG